MLPSFKDDAATRLELRACSVAELNNRYRAMTRRISSNATRIPPTAFNAPGILSSVASGAYIAHLRAQRDLIVEELHRRGEVEPPAGGGDTLAGMLIGVATLGLAEAVAGGIHGRKDPEDGRGGYSGVNQGSGGGSGGGMARTTTSAATAAALQGIGNALTDAFMRDPIEPSDPFGPSLRDGIRGWDSPSPASARRPASPRDPSMADLIRAGLDFLSALSSISSARKSF